jgi:hypothetical protein
MKFWVFNQISLNSRHILDLDEILCSRNELASVPLMHACMHAVFATLHWVYFTYLFLRKKRACFTYTHSFIKMSIQMSFFCNSKFKTQITNKSLDLTYIILFMYRLKIIIFKYYFMWHQELIKNILIYTIL